jgi:hypothetical protein
MIENPVELPEKSGDASHIQILREQDGTRDAVAASMDPFRRRIAGEALQKLQCVKIVPMLAEPSVSKQTSTPLAASAFRAPGAMAALCSNARRGAASATSPTQLSSANQGQHPNCGSRCSIVCRTERARRLGSGRRTANKMRSGAAISQAIKNPLKNGRSLLTRSVQARHAALHRAPFRARPFGRRTRCPRRS